MSRRLAAWIVVDLGFGDAGKGLLTDYLVRETGAGLVVRYNGGAQAGHNVVVADGRHHTFSQLGAGSFVPGVRTYLSRHVVVHPTALLREAEVLAAKGVPDALARLAVSERATVVTPFHQAAGRLRELARGAQRHGSCGVGIGEAVADALAFPTETVLAADLRDPQLVLDKARRVRARKAREMEALAARLPPGPVVVAERRSLASEAIAGAWVAEACRLARLGAVTSDATLAGWLAGAESVVFEGAQGVLLDESYGFHPYTAWSRATPENALALLAEAAPGRPLDLERLGVLRTHAVRHGPGPLPTETGDLAAAVVEHNRRRPWQGPVRYGWWDAVLARYALAAAGPFERLALTHLDLPARLATWQLAEGYRFPDTAVSPDLIDTVSPGGVATHLAPPVEHSIERQQRLTVLLAAARPIYCRCPADDGAVLAESERLLGRTFDLVAHGARAADVAPRP